MTHPYSSFCAPLNALPLIVAAAVTLTAPSLANALEANDLSFETTEDLIQVCATTADDPAFVPAQTACTAFIEATLQYHDAVSDRRNLKRLVCYPAGTSIADGRAALLKWADQHAGDAAKMSELPVIGLVRALADAYPCK
jgi:hypothetical protein